MPVFQGFRRDDFERDFVQQAHGAWLSGLFASTQSAAVSRLRLLSQVEP